MIKSNQIGNGGFYETCEFFELTGAPSKKALADYLGVPASNISNWIRNERPIPSRHCAKIEQFTKGAVKMEELRPDFPWDDAKRVIADRISSV